MRDNWRHHDIQPIGAFLPKFEEPKMEYQKYVPLEGKGKIKKNYKKQEGDKKPHWEGTMMHKGEIIEFGVWENEGQYGKWFTINVKDPNYKEKVKDAQYPKDITPREPRKMAGDVPW